MKRTSNFHNGIARTDDTETAGFFDNATAFDTTVDMFNANPDGGKLLIEGFLRRRQFTTFGLFERGQTGNVLKGKGQKAQVLEQTTAGRQGVGMVVSNAFIMDTPSVGLGEQENRQGQVN